MTRLSDFSDEQRELLIRLPYQVGINISDADDVEGTDDDVLEMRALASILRALPGLYHRVPLIQEICRETLRREKEWPEWHEGTFDLTRECKEAVNALHAHATKEEAKAYRKALLQVADAVARAAGEYGAVTSIRDEPDSPLLKMLTGFFQIFGQAKRDYLSNISPAEQEAIDKIAGALQVD